MRRLDMLVGEPATGELRPGVPTREGGDYAPGTPLGEALKGWKIYPLPMDRVSSFRYPATRARGRASIGQPSMRCAGGHVS